MGDGFRLRAFGRRLFRSLVMRLRLLAPARGGPLLTGQVLAGFKRLPKCDFAALFGTGPILVLMPHPDDESLGCGGMIAQACARGHDIHLAVLTDGAASHPDSRLYPPERVREIRGRELLEAAARLGLPARRIELLGLPDRSLPAGGQELSELVDRLQRRYPWLGIGSVCTTWAHDPHPDHRAAAAIAAELCRRVGARRLQVPVWAWKLPWHRPWPEPVPSGARLPVRPQLETKRRAIDAHRSQVTGLISDSRYAPTIPRRMRRHFESGWETYLFDG